MNLLDTEDISLKCKALIKILKHLGGITLSFVMRPMMIVNDNDENMILALWATGKFVANDAMATTLVASKHCMSLRSPSGELCIMSNDTSYAACNIEDIEKFFAYKANNSNDVIQPFLVQQFMPNMYKLVESIDYALNNGYDIQLAYINDLRTFETIAKAGQSLEEVAIQLELAI